MFRSHKTKPSPKGITDHEIKASMNVRTGAARKIIKLALLGRTVSFTISFNPSAIGWRIPNTPTTLGPFLLWIDPITFLSARTMKAIPKRRGTTKPRIFKRTPKIYDMESFFIISKRASIEKRFSFFDSLKVYSLGFILKLR